MSGERVETSLERVIEGLRLDDQFGLHVISCATEACLVRARERLLAEAGDAPLVSTEVSVSELGRGGPQALVERLLHDTARGVLVLGAAVMPEYPDRWALVFQRLNESRDRIKACFDGLVLLLLEPLKPVLAHNAADFWSIRSSSVTLGSSEEDDGDELLDEELFGAGDDDDAPAEVASPAPLASVGLPLHDREGVDALAAKVEEFARSYESTTLELEPELARGMPKGAVEVDAPELRKEAAAPSAAVRRGAESALPAGAGAPARKKGRPSEPPPRTPAATMPEPSAPMASSVGKPKVRGTRRSSLLGGVIGKLRSWARPGGGGRGLSGSAQPLTLLLLSSLHVTDRGKGSAQLESRLRALVEDADRARASSSVRPFDLVVVAGDITARGRPSEMSEARATLRHLVRRLAAEERVPSLMLVPGNHDIGKDKPKWRRETTKSVDLDAVMGQRHNLGRAKQAGSGYRMLVDQLHADGVVARAPQMEPYTLLGVELEHDGRVIALRGLDSAWSQPWSGKGAALLGSQQLAYALDGLEHADLRVAVVHHGPQVMDPDEWAVLDEAFDLVLTGAAHEDAPVVTVSDRGTTVVAAPGLVGTPCPGHVALELGPTLRVYVRWLDGEREPSVHELAWRRS